MNSDINAPLYATIYHSLLERIQKQQNGYTNKLPSERDLMEEFETTRVTLRVALSQLEREGCIYRSNRRGWFVTPSKLIYDPSLRFNFSVWAMKQGRKPETELLTSGLKSCKSAQEGELLGLKRGDKIVEMTRRRSIDGRHVLLEEIAVDAKRFPGLLDHDLSTSITSIFKDFYNVEVVRDQVAINATALSREQAEELSVADGSFCFLIERTRYDGSDNPIEVDREFWLHNAIEIRVDA